MKNKFAYYILSLTWGLPLTLIGAIVACVLICTGHKPKRWGGCVYFNVGKNWGGLELGLFFLTDSTGSEHTKNHEFGHSIQNCRWGFLMPFVICIPSAVRYWYRELTGKKDTPYDAIWFEGEATELGYKYIEGWHNGGKR